MDEIRVASWSELNEALYGESWQEPLGRFRSDFVFRGVSNAHYSTLATSLMRLGDGYQRLEGHLLRNFRKYAFLESREKVPVDSVWNWLAMAQHHGLPTRMLDWSYSPFVALHFATAPISDMDDDGLLWCLNYVKSREFLPQRLRVLLDEEGAFVFTAEMLQETTSTLAAFDALGGMAGDERHEFVAFFEPPSIDARIVNQWALFSLMSRSDLALDDWLADHPDLYRRIVIPAEIKWEVRDKLDQANITERVLFPGLDGLSSWLKRYYTPRLSQQQHDEPSHSTAVRLPTEQ
jgi:hypothetical protein